MAMVVRGSTSRWLRAIAAVATIVMASSVLVGVPTATPSAAASPVPTQWIAKQYTELLGRAPTAAEWNDWVSHYEGVPTCSATTLKTLGKELGMSDEFLVAYPEATSFDRLVRVAALIRATLNHDPNTNDVAGIFEPYDDGTRNWEQTIDAVHGAATHAANNVPRICDPTDPNYGWESFPPPLDLRSIVGLGASRTRAELQADLDAAAPDGTVELQPGEVVVVGGPANGNQGLVVPAGVTLTTAGSPGPDQYMLMGRIVPAYRGLVCVLFLCNQIGIVTVQPGATLSNVFVDGQNISDKNYKQANIDAWGGQGSSNPITVSDNRVSEPSRDGVGIRARGSSVFDLECSPTSVTGNLITGYGTRHQFDGLGQAEWADGIAVHCGNTTVDSNEIVDVTDAGITVHGSFSRTVGDTGQQSQVTNNTVLSAGHSAHVALGASPIGECYNFLRGSPDEPDLPFGGGWLVPCLDIPATGGQVANLSFQGAAIDGNTFFTGSRTHFDIGLLVGGLPLWGDHRVGGNGVAVTNNTTQSVGARINIGISVLGMQNATVTGNTTSFSLVDGKPNQTRGKCPQVEIAVGDTESATLTTDLSYTPRDDHHACLVGEAPAEGLEPLAVNAAGDGFIGTTTGRPFTPWGARVPGPELDFDLDDADFDFLLEHFREVKRMGMNMVRLRINFRSLIDELPGEPVGTPNEAAIADLVETVELAAQTGLYVELSGLRITIGGDGGDWYSNTTEEERWQNHQVFWSSVASALAGNPAIAWFDLMNEPVVPGQEVPTWCHPNSCFVQYITRTPNGRTSEEIVRAWMPRMVDAIKVTAGDPDRLVSIGNIFCVGGLAPQVTEDYLDFGSLHRYPSGTADDDIAFVQNCKPDNQPIVVDEVLVSGINNVEYERFFAEAGAAGFVTHYAGITQTEPKTPSEPSDTIPDAIIQRNSRHFLRLAGFMQPTGTGTLQP